MNKILSKIAYFSIFLLLFQFCKEEEKNAPEIPDTLSFIMEFPDLTEVKKYKKENSNAIFSFEKLEVWNNIIFDSLAVAKKSYIELLKTSEAVYLEENTWLQTFDFNINSIDFTGKFYSKTENDSLDLKMYLSKTGEYQNFLWFYGYFDINLTSGQWILFDKPPVNEYEPQELILIDWSNKDEENFIIKYTNIKSSSTDNGNYITYNKNSDENFPDIYSIYNKGQDNFTTIELNQNTKKGRVKSIIHFNDNEWHCWNENLENIDCE